MMMSLDGYVASRDGSETWMTAPDPGRDTADGRAAGRPARDQLRLARGPPTSTGSVSVLATRPGRPHRSASATTGRQARAGHQIRIVEHLGDVAERVRNLHLADAPSEPVKVTFASHIFLAQQGIRGLRHAKPPYRNGGSRPEAFYLAGAKERSLP